MTKLSGIINVNKPMGFTSHDVVAKIRKILGIKQVGHTGTLDPIATGVLPVCIGKATKTIQYLDSSKAYRAYLKLGVRTNTFDTEGEILEQNLVNLDVEQIKSYLNDFRGEIKQKPPMFSAVHYKGKRLYEYARKNIEIDDIPERTITVKSIELVEVQEIETPNPVAVIDVDCSSGTYIRSIINDLGNKLGYGACMEGLIRTRACGLKISDSYTIDKIAELVKYNELDGLIINPLDVIELEKIKINDFQLDKITKGQSIDAPSDISFNGLKIALTFDNKLAAIAEVKENKIYPVNVFI